MYFLLLYEILQCCFSSDLHYGVVNVGGKSRKNPEAGYFPTSEEREFVLTENTAVYSFFTSGVCGRADHKLYSIHFWLVSSIHHNMKVLKELRSFVNPDSA